MSGKRYTEEFKVEAAKQVTERGHPVAEVASRLGVTTHSLYKWVKKYGASAPERQATQGQEAEIRKLKAELKRVTEECDILKGVHACMNRTLPRRPVRYAFIREHEDQYPVLRLCKVMALHPSGYYAWRTNPQSKRSIEDRRLLGHMEQSWLESGAVYVT